jgi:predicted membrane chloride channel (bestrophin family)
MEGKPYLPEEELIKRSKECQLVLDKLLTDEVWKIVINDCRTWVKRLDAKWQEVYDEKQLNQLRILKSAYAHIANLPEKYKDEYKYVVEELQRRNNKEVIEKDYDTETILED